MGDVCLYDLIHIRKVEHNNNAPCLTVKRVEMYVFTEPMKSAAYEVSLESSIECHLLLIGRKPFLMIVGRQVNGVDRFVAMLSANPQVADSGCGPPEEKAGIVICCHRYMQVQGNMAMSLCMLRVL